MREQGPPAYQADLFASRAFPRRWKSDAISHIRQSRRLTDKGGETLFFFRRKKRFEVVSGIVAGKEVTYSFTRPIPEERAQREFKAAAEKRLPSGSVIIIP